SELPEVQAREMDGGGFHQRTAHQRQYSMQDDRGSSLRTSVHRRSSCSGEVTSRSALQCCRSDRALRGNPGPNEIALRLGAEVLLKLQHHSCAAKMTRIAASNTRRDCREKPI